MKCVPFIGGSRVFTETYKRISFIMTYLEKSFLVFLMILHYFRYSEFIFFTKEFIFITTRCLSLNFIVCIAFIVYLYKHTKELLQYCLWKKNKKKKKSESSFSVQVFFLNVTNYLLITFLYKFCRFYSRLHKI